MLQNNSLNVVNIQTGVIKRIIKGLKECLNVKEFYHPIYGKSIFVMYSEEGKFKIKIIA